MSLGSFSPNAGKQNGQDLPAIPAVHVEQPATTTIDALR